MNIKLTQSIDSQVFKDALRIRLAVFVKEQHVPTELELEDNEEINTHFVGYLDEQPVITTRIRPIENHGFLVQRVATDAHFRHQGLGRELFDFIEDYVRKQQGTYLKLGAQDQAIPFYQKLGFTLLELPGYMDAGIHHQEMQKNLN